MDFILKGICHLIDEFHLKKKYHLKKIGIKLMGVTWKKKYHQTENLP